MQESSDETIILGHLPDITEDLQNCVQTNGVRTTGPPPNWSGSIPSHDCELHIRKIPNQLTEIDLMPHFKRFGEIYEFRLMMDYNAQNRGFAFVKFTTEKNALRALEVLSHLYILPGKRLEIEKSYDKCRLFIGNIPKNLTYDQVYKQFQLIFPEMVRLVLHREVGNANRNRGFAFADFQNHQSANSAKLQISATNSHCQLWGKPLKIIWANPERSIDHHTLSQTKTLFIRNVDMSISRDMLKTHLATVVDRKRIDKIARTRECAFVDFKDRDACEIVMKNLNGIKLKNVELDIQWALPPAHDSVHHMRQMDFDKELRLKCIANRWGAPVYLFGRLFAYVQYVAVMLHHHNGEPRVYFFEMALDTADLQSRTAECVVTLIKVFGTLPEYNYVMKVSDNVFHIGKFKVIFEM